MVMAFMKIIVGFTRQAIVVMAAFAAPNIAVFSRMATGPRKPGIFTKPMPAVLDFFL